MKSVAAIGLAAAMVAFAGTGQAQTPPSPAAQTVDPVKLGLAQQVLEASGGTKQAQAVVDNMYVAMEGAMSKSLPPAQVRVMAAMRQTMQREFTKMLPALMDMSARAYARELTQAELKDLLAWERSASGQAILRKQPAIMQQVMAEEMPMLFANMPKIMQAVIDETCNEAHCSAADRQMITAAMSQALQSRGS